MQKISITLNQIEELTDLLEKNNISFDQLLNYLKKIESSKECYLELWNSLTE